LALIDILLSNPFTVDIQTRNAHDLLQEDEWMTLTYLEHRSRGEDEIVQVRNRPHHHSSERPNAESSTLMGPGCTTQNTSRRKTGEIDKPLSVPRYKMSSLFQF